MPVTNLPDLTDLPDEILIQILSNCTPAEIATMALTSRLFAILAQDAGLWQTKFSQLFPAKYKNDAHYDHPQWLSKFQNKYAKYFACVAKDSPRLFALYHASATHNLTDLDEEAIKTVSINSFQAGLAVRNNSYLERVCTLAYHAQNQAILDLIYRITLNEIKRLAGYSDPTNTPDKILCYKRLLVIAILCHQPLVEIDRLLLNDELLKNDYWTDRGLYPLVVFAAFSNFTRLVQHIIEKYPEERENFDGYGQTSLLWAAARGNNELVKYLLRKKANVNCQTQAVTASIERLTAIGWAVKGGLRQTVALLLAAGADIKLDAQRVGEGISNIIYLAASARQVNIFMDLVAQLAPTLSEKVIILQNCIRYGWSHMFMTYYDRYYQDLSVETLQGFVMVSLRESNVEILIYLLRTNPAFVTTFESEILEALSERIDIKKAKYFRMLLPILMQFKEQALSSYQILSLRAAEYGNVLFLQQFLHTFPEALHYEYDGISALEIAADKGYWDIVHYLISRGAPCHFMLCFINPILTTAQVHHWRAVLFELPFADFPKQMNTIGFLLSKHEALDPATFLYLRTTQYLLTQKTLLQAEQLRALQDLQQTIKQFHRAGIAQTCRSLQALLDYKLPEINNIIHLLCHYRILVRDPCVLKSLPLLFNAAQPRANQWRLIPEREHLFLIDQQGNAYAKGENTWRPLGVSQDTMLEVNQFIRSPANQEITHIQTVANVSVFTDRDGNFFISGFECHRYTLAEVTDIACMNEIIVPNHARIKEVILIHNAIFIRDAHNIWWTAGANRSQQLGMNFRDESNKFNMLHFPDFRPIKKVVASSYVTAVKDDADKWYVCGDLSYIGQAIADGFQPLELPEQKRVIEVKMAPFTSFVRDEEGFWYSAGRYSLQKLELFNHKPIKDIIVGNARHFFARDNEDNWYACGLNDKGAFGKKHGMSVNQFVLITLPDNTQIAEVQIVYGRTYIRNADDQWYVCGKSIEISGIPNVDDDFVPFDINAIVHQPCSNATPPKSRI